MASLGIGTLVVLVGPYATLSHQVGPAQSGDGWSVERLIDAGSAAYLRHDLRDLERAAHFFESALDRAPTDARALAGLSMTRRAQAVNFHQGAQRLEEAAQLAREALRSDPSSIEAHRAMGQVWAGLGRADLAVSSYTHALELLPDNSAVAENLAIAYMSLGRFRESARTLIEIAPPSSRESIHLVNLGRAMALLGDLDKARQYLERSILANPLGERAAHNLVRVHLAAGNLDEAVRRLPRFVGINESPLLLTARADIALIQGDTKSALVFLEEAISGLGPEDLPDAFARLMFVRAERGADVGPRLTAALEWLRREGTSGERWRLAQALAGAHMAFREHDLAIEVLERAAARGGVDGPWLAVDPIFQTLHGNRRFEGLVNALAARAKSDREALGIGPAAMDG